MEPKTEKRIVSKEAYWRTIRVKYLLVICTTLLMLFTVVYCPLSLWHLLPSNPNSPLLIPMLALLVLMVPLCCCMVYWTIKGIKEIIRIDPGVPLTRANTANLPAPDSLVRASEQPLQAQEGVLLRGAAEGMETPPEQLVRASVGME